MTSFRNFISNERDKATAQKRGGGKTHVSLEFSDAERRYSLEPVETETAERLFYRRWATMLLERVLDDIQLEYEQSGRANVFAELSQYLTPGSVDEYSDVAQRLEMTEGAVKVAVHRLRSRYRERLFAEIAETTATHWEVDDEIRCLFAAFAKA